MVHPFNNERNGRPVRVMLVDDNPDDRLLVKEAFADTDGLELSVVVEDGASALACLRREGPYESERQPDLVLLDINIPAMNGFEVLDTVKADPGLQHIPIAMFTSSDSAGDVRRSYSHGACSYIAKPLGFTDYLQMAATLRDYWAGVSITPTS
jgi:CheY-like chemotaxis protein